MGSGKGKAEETQGGTPIFPSPPCRVGIAGFKSSAIGGQKQAVEQSGYGKSRCMDTNYCKYTDYDKCM